MSGPVLKVDGIGKAFRRFDHEIKRVASWFVSGIAPTEERWVLRDISFDVGAGEALAIVGVNGAGKSTLLKLVAGTYRPTEGRISTRGRVAAILELGMGFSGDFTGRQNVYHGAGLMGFDGGQIAAVIDEIQEFAEIDPYFDQPLRVYSSGMQMRLAFAVATAFRPDILIIDEALAVGDAYFQHKSMQRIRSFQEQGTAMILVSHDRASVQSLCSRAILLENGKIALDGPPEEVLDYYNARIAQKEGDVIETVTHKSGKKQTISGTREATISGVALQSAEGAEVEIVPVGAAVVLKVTASVHQAIDSLVLGYSIKNRLGQVLFGTNTQFTGQAASELRPGDSVAFAVAFPANLGVGDYSIALALAGSESHLSKNFEWRDLALTFSVANPSEQPFDGQVWIPPTVEVTVTRAGE